MVPRLEGVGGGAFCLHLGRVLKSSTALPSMFTSPVTWRSGGTLCVAILLAACMVYYHVGLLIPRVSEVRAAEGFGNGYSFGADFYPIWLTAREGLVHHRDPYSPQTASQIQIDLFGRIVDSRIFGAPPAYWTFAYPAFADVLFWPIALLPFFVVRIGFGLILAGLTAFSVVLWLRVLQFHPRPVTVATLIVLTLSSYAVLEGLFAEQMGLLVGFFLAASLAAVIRERFFFSGSLLALTLIKPQIMLLITAYLLLWSLARWRARWPLVGGFLLMASLLGASSLLVWRHWIPEWLHVIFAYRRYSPPPLVSLLLGNQIGPFLGPVLMVAFLLSSVLLSWRMRLASAKSSEFRLTVSIILAITSIALLPGQAVYDHVVLLPGIILIALSWRDLQASPLFRTILAVTTLAVFWQWITAPVIIAVHPFVLRQPFMPAMLTIPIRTAASIPFAVFALLVLMMVYRRDKIDERVISTVGSVQ
jgi:Glycosyltransferase family 87